MCKKETWGHILPSLDHRDKVDGIDISKTLL